MANNISDLYNQVINEHRKYPRNKGLIEGYKTLHLKNPSCGDDVTVQVEIKDGITRIGDYAFYECGNLIEVSKDNGDVGKKSWAKIDYLCKVTLTTYYRIA